MLRLEDAGASAIVMHSLFEEDLVEQGVEPHEYLEQLLRIKRRTDLPVIASLNGTTAEGWLRYAALLEQAGADALELNFYHVATDPLEDGVAVEHRVVDIVAVLKESIADSARRQAVAVLLVAAAPGGARSIASAPTVWCCSTGSISRTSIRERRSGHARAALFRFVRAAAAAALDRDARGPGERRRWRSPAACTSRSTR